MIDYAAQIAVASVATLVAVEVARFLPLPRVLTQVRTSATRAVSVVRSKAISDHWKERTLPVYAGRIFTASLLLLACLVALAVAFVLPFRLGWALLAEGSGWSAALMRADILLVSLGVAIISLWLRPMRGNHD